MMDLVLGVHSQAKGGPCQPSNDPEDTVLQLPSDCSRQQEYSKGSPYTPLLVLD